VAQSERQKYKITTSIYLFNSLQGLSAAQANFNWVTRKHMPVIASKDAIRLFFVMFRAIEAIYTS